MKHSKAIATVATAGGFFAMSSAHAFAPAVAAVWAAVIGAGIGSTAGNNHPNEVAAAPAPAAVAVVPGSTNVMGGPPVVVQEVIPAPQDGFRWERGHHEWQNGSATFVPGHWVAQ